ncbi:NAD(P)-dependent oxidoreductase [Polynucleobacter sp. MG-6-Vaara-E2]|uniref:NAD-dependent epimerase/dehydratase family protein n=1 Tax=Polynucleobacter sp. MG-6-Vaara-E2 TaxID=2576932 RepID=UPI001BFD2E92|nr:NAD(P)-dependent oxidoreductase [Polynucleobacter sp. MG-6-Vaara-E2]QWD96894.1 NAD(P)-dependent oxidoreductase [Polynucleobacter sp. MG-6-Vaara-E2]
MNILLTGATGFLGSHLLKKLLQTSDHQITILKRSTSNVFRITNEINSLEFLDADTKNLKELIESREKRFDCIIHCATDFGRKKTLYSEMIQSNVLLPLELIEYCSKWNQLKCFINIDTLLDKNISAYSLSKHQFKEWLQKHSHSLCAINVGIEHFYGPGDDDSKFTSHVIRQLMNLAPKIELTPGQQIRDFIYIDDVVNALELIIRTAKISIPSYQEFNIATGESITIENFVRLVQKICCNKTTELQFGALPYRENELMASTIDTSKIVELGWKPNFSLEAGLTKTIELERKTLA